jgi:Ca2+-binding EF-hand superfamily protein
MSKFTLGACVLALSLGLAPLGASAQEAMPGFDRNKDGLVSKKEFLDEMSRRYDAAMAKAKAMPKQEQAKMMRNNQISDALLAQLIRDVQAGGRN